MFEFQYEQVAPYVITKQRVEDGYVYWVMPDGEETTDFNRCVSEWKYFLNQKLEEKRRGY